MIPLRIVASIGALLVCSALFAQDYRPHKDKETRKFGYRDKSKNWVIEPRFDKAGKFSRDGFAVVTENGFKGAIDLSGEYVIQPEYTQLYLNEMAYARSGFNGLWGILSLDGREVVPFANLGIHRSMGVYSVLNSRFDVEDYSSEGRLTAVHHTPGSVIPYNPDGDVVRIATFGHSMVGARVHVNQMRLCELDGVNVTCDEFQTDWGRGSGRFVRLEVTAHEKGMPDCFSRVPYTVSANLYEQDGTFVDTLSRFGRIECVSREFIVYRAEEVESWLIARDVNHFGPVRMRRHLTELTYPGTNTIQDNVLMNAREIGQMYDPEEMADRNLWILRRENAGITQYMPFSGPRHRGGPAPDRRFEHASYSYDRVAMAVTRGVGAEKLIVADRPGVVVRCHDVMEPFGFTINESQDIWFGPRQMRFIRLEMLPKKPAGPDAPPEMALIVNLFGENGGFIRVLGVSDHWFELEGGALYLEDMKMVLSPRPIRPGERFRLLPPPQPHDGQAPAGAPAPAGDRQEAKPQDQHRSR